MKTPITFARGLFVSTPKKGITAVVAIVLLLMMTVGAAGLAYVWVTNLQGNVQTKAGEGVTDIANQQDAKIAIDSVYNDTSVTPNLVKVIVRNIGRYTFVDEGNFQVYYGGVPVTVTGFTDGTSNAPKTVRTVVLPATSNFPKFGETKEVKITSEISTATITYTCSPTTSAATSC